MYWNGRRYRPAQPPKVYPRPQDSITELLKPLGEKERRGNVWIPVQQIPMNVPKEETSNVTPSPTPTNTATPSPTPSQTPTQTGTATSTPTPTSTTTTTPTPNNTTTTTPTPTPTPSSTPFSYDTDAAAYLNAVVNAGGSGLTSTISAATNTLFVSLKSNSLYTKMIAFYPFLGQNSAGCKFNAKNPVDSDAAFRLTYNGGFTFNASGETGNGTNGYADTYVTSGYSALMVYSLSTGSTGYDMGREEATNDAYIITKYSANQDAYLSVGGNSPVQISDSPGADGLYIGVKTGTTQTLYRNGSSIGSNSGGGTLPAQSILLHAAYTTGDFSNHTLGFAGIASGITSSEVSTLSSVINTFMTSINRNTY